jgi:hypothetical protein
MGGGREQGVNGRLQVRSGAVTVLDADNDAQEYYHSMHKMRGSRVHIAYIHVLIDASHLLGPVRLHPIGRLAPRVHDRIGTASIPARVSVERDDVSVLKALVLLDRSVTSGGEKSQPALHGPLG